MVRIVKVRASFFLNYTLSHLENGRDISASKDKCCKTYPLGVNQGILFFLMWEKTQKLLT